MLFYIISFVWHEFTFLVLIFSDVFLNHRLCYIFRILLYKLILIGSYFLSLSDHLSLSSGLELPLPHLLFPPLQVQDQISQ